MTLPVWLVRGALVVLVVIVVLAGHWLIPTSIGIVPRLIALSALVIIVLWLVTRITPTRYEHR